MATKKWILSKRIEDLWVTARKYGQVITLDAFDKGDSNFSDPEGSNRCQNHPYQHIPFKLKKLMSILRKQHIISFEPSSLNVLYHEVKYHNF